MADLEYKPVEPYTRETAEAMLSSGDVPARIDALLSIAFYEEFEFAQERCIQFSNHPDEDVRGIAILCLGHIARIHGKISHERVQSILQAGLGDPSFFV